MNHDELSLIGRDPSIIAPFLKKLFNEYDRQGLSWAVMRGWERLPEWTRYDVDILVAQKDLKRAYMIAELIGRKLGWRMPRRSAFFMRRPVWLFRIDEKGFSSLRLDIMDRTPFHWRWKDDTDRSLGVREKCEKGFWCLPIWYVGASVLVKELSLHHKIEGKLRFDQMQRASELPKFQDLLRETFEDDDLVDKLVAASRKRDAMGFEQLAVRVNKIISAKKIKRPLSWIVYIARGVCKRLTSDLCFFVALIGPDGCGKTTIADYIQTTFKSRPFGIQMRIKSDFGMPRLRSLKIVGFKLIGKKAPEHREPPPGTKHMGMQKPHSRMRAMVYVMYYGIGMLIGRVKILLSYAYCRQIIADRYFYDYYYQNNFRNCPRWFVKVCGVLAPKPDLIVVLDRPARDIYNGKPELTVCEIEREQKIIKDIFGSLKNCSVIDAGNGLMRTLRLVERAVADGFIYKWCQ